MKAIGLIPNGRHGSKLIVEMTEDEWKKIVNDEYSPLNVVVGQTGDVGKVFDRAKRLKQNQGELKKAMQSLRAIADLLEPLEGVVGCDPQPATNEAESNG